LAGAAAVLALAVFPLAVGDYAAAAVTEVLIFSIFAMSLDLLIGYTGLMSFGHAAFFGLGAYAVVIPASHLGLNPWLGVLAGVAIAAFGAAIIGYFCVRVAGIAFLMMTMAFSQLLYSVCLRWRSVTGGSDGLGGVGDASLFGWSLADPQVMYYVALAAFLFSYLSLVRLVGSPLGHAFIGIRENEPRMRAIGYNSRAYKLLACTIAGAYAGLSGSIYALYNGFVSPEVMHWATSGDVLVMVMLGGAGTLSGPVIGTALFLLIKNFVSSHTEHWLLVVGLLFIACVMFFRQGVWGTLAARWSRR
jgi:branched-chain amino acid transport system permease protein